MFNFFKNKRDIEDRILDLEQRAKENAKAIKQLNCPHDDTEIYYSYCGGLFNFDFRVFNFDFRGREICKICNKTIKFFNNELDAQKERLKQLKEKAIKLENEIWKEEKEINNGNASKAE